MITLNTDSAQEFLARVVPWDGKSFVSIHHTFPIQNPRDPKRPFGMKGTSNRDLGGAMNTLRFIAGRQNTRDIYVCMSSLRTAKECSKNRARWFQSDKHADNAVSLKSFFIDVDVKDGAYASTRDALAALVRFCKAIDLPLPTGIVESGTGGFHAYWVLSQPLSIAEWQSLADALAEATKANGLICDTQCTVDCVRILRVPGTFNFKHDPALPVIMRPFSSDDFSVDRIARALAPYIGQRVTSAVLARATPIGALLPPRSGAVDPALLDELASGVTITAAPPARLDEMTPHCAFLAEAVATGGRDFRNPLWNLTTLLATFCEEGEQAAHRMASGHRDYTVESTADLYARKTQERAARDLGWPQCRAISTSGYAGCAVCQHYSAGRSPLNFGRPAPVTQQVVAAPSTRVSAQLPDGYEWGTDDHVYLLITDDQGNTNRLAVFPRSIREPWVQKNPWILHWITEDDDGRDQRVRLLFESFSAKDKMSKELANQGIVLTDNTFRAFQRFVMSWMERLHQHAISVVDSHPFGWVKVGGAEGFVYGGRIWNVGPDLPAGIADVETSRQYSPNGDLAPWIAAAKMTTDQGRPGLDAILASAFAAPLARFIGQTGLMMSVWSTETGIGKSTTVKIAQAVWGDPRFSESHDATLNSVLGKIGALRHLPMYWDELRGKGLERFAELAFKLTQGTEKSRMNSDMTQRKRGTWQTLLVSASNSSVVDLLAQQSKDSAAGVARTLEFRLTRGVSGRIGISEAGRMVSRLSDHYGVVGLAYAKWLGANAARCDKDVETLAKWVEAKLNPAEDERLWTATITVLLQGAAYANALGFTQIDLDALRAFLFNVYGEMRAEVKSEPIDVGRTDVLAGIVAQYLAHVGARHTLRTNTMTYAAGGVPANGLRILSDTSRIDSILVQIAEDDKIARISEAQFFEWLRESGHQKKVVVQALEKHGAVRARRTLGGGTALQADTRPFCIDVDLDRLAQDVV
jgi:hypothetical protein